MFFLSFDFHLSHACRGLSEAGQSMLLALWSEGSRTAAEQRWVLSWGGLSYLNISSDQL